MIEDEGLADKSTVSTVKEVTGLVNNNINKIFTCNSELVHG